MADPIAEPLAITSPSSSALDNVISQASIPLTSEELYIVPDRDIPMEEPLETRDLLVPPEMEEIVLRGAHGSSNTHSPCPQIW
jgi:hypothetical protein